MEPSEAHTFAADRSLKGYTKTRPYEDGKADPRSRSLDRKHTRRSTKESSCDYSPRRRSSRSESSSSSEKNFRWRTKKSKKKKERSTSSHKKQKKEKEKRDRHSRRSKKSRRRSRSRSSASSVSLNGCSVLSGRRSPRQSEREISNRNASEGWSEKVNKSTTHLSSSMVETLTAVSQPAGANPADCDGDEDDNTASNYRKAYGLTVGDYSFFNSLITSAATSNLTLVPEAAGSQEKQAAKTTLDKSKHWQCPKCNRYNYQAEYQCLGCKRLRGHYR